MQFIAAVWGIVFVVLFPVMMLISPVSTNGLPAYVPLLWLITAIAGFVVPCFLIAFKLYKPAAILCAAGAGALLFVHAALPNNAIMWFYMPLLLELPIAVGIAILDHKQKQKEHDNAKAPSILD